MCVSVSCISQHNAENLGLLRWLLLLEFGVFQFDSGLAGELGTAVRESGSLVGLLLVQLALVISQRQRSAVFDQL